MADYKVKIFSTNQGFKDLENEINIWLHDNSIEVRTMQYQDNNKYASAMLVYEEVK